ncbi:hypothetical protein NKH18_02555 [Streptomyces sp. M10(2022)]
MSATLSPTAPVPSSAAPTTEASPTTEEAPSEDASSPPGPSSLYDSSPRSGKSLVTDLPAFEGQGYQAGAQKVNVREYPIALRGSGDGPFDCKRTVATWQLDRTYKSLVAGIGISDDSPTGSSAEFTISVDDRTRFQRTMGWERARRRRPWISAGRSASP